MIISSQVCILMRHGFSLFNLSVHLHWSRINWPFDNSRKKEKKREKERERERKREKERKNFQRGKNKSESEMLKKIYNKYFINLANN